MTKRGCLGCSYCCCCCWPISCSSNRIISNIQWPPVFSCNSSCPEWKICLKLTLKEVMPLTNYLYYSKLESTFFQWPKSNESWRCWPEIRHFLLLPLFISRFPGSSNRLLTLAGSLIVLCCLNSYWNCNILLKICQDTFILFGKVSITNSKGLATLYFVDIVTTGWQRCA